MKTRKEPKIDFVVTWVDGNDKNWRAEKKKWALKEKDCDTKLFKEWIDSDIRYRDWDILKYWFRAIETHASWVNKIYFVTWGHIPNWLDTNNPKLVIVKHEDFIPKEYLPTFNSNAIELNIHRIKGLSEHFVYFNDDVFINANVKKTDFFKNGLPRETAGFDCIRTNYDTMNADINNAKILNNHFSKRKSIKKDWGKWLNPQNGRFLLKTICLTPWEKITGISELHITCAYRKSVFKEVWKNEFERLNKTCLNKFRKADNVNHWVIKGWQLLSGKFYVRSSKFGKAYRSDEYKRIVEDIERSKHKIICINDYANSIDDFEIQQKNIKNALEKKYPAKSKYETD